ncbi:hypothetical protein PV326_010327 [Microctonus aethiopoides]|nr:hypothetical protein PV326_010327 [Microctonus aethiopoides]
MEPTTSHAVIKFIDELNEEGKKLLDLVPVTWLKKTNTDSWFSFYPPISQYNKLSRWSATSKIPEKNWKQYPVEIIKQAETFEQGMRRLDRAYADSNIESTDKENLPKDQTVIEKITSSDACVILGKMGSKTNKKRNKRVHSSSDSSDDSMHALKILFGEM